MKFKQGYASSAMKAFRFVEKHQLEPYNNIEDDLVVFGVYDKNDIEVIKNHKGRVVVQWEGLDCKRYGHLDIFKRMDIINVSPHFRIVDYFKTIGVACHEIRWITDEKPRDQVLGSEVYAYVNKNNRNYYGGDIIDALNYPILIADYSMPMNEWKAGPCEFYYSKAFLSLQLSPFAGGGFSIMELGLRGVKVVTNILKMPHCIAWKNSDDIRRIIKEESKNIGKENKGLSQSVYKELIDVNINPEYDLEKLII